MAANPISRATSGNIFFLKFSKKYRNQVILEGMPLECRRKEYYQVIAERVAHLYVETIESNINFLETLNKSCSPSCKSQNLDQFFQALTQHISTELSNGRAIDLVTNKTPQGTLKNFMDQCDIYTGTITGNFTFSLLPFKSRVYITPRIQEEYCFLDGLDISIESTQAELPSGIHPDFIPRLI